jgi:type IV pilus assembly protein PilY1
MTRSCTRTLGWLLAVLLLPAAASAQDGPDIRDLRPFLMLVVDTSGSMERQVDCPCITRGCTECLPTCDVGNTPSAPEPKKNRWAVTLEALTGSFKDFQCEKLDRTTANGASYDRNYYLPYHQPWDCTYPQVAASDGNVEQACAYNATGVLSPLQNEDGILDSYESRVRFGLMTFDGVATYAGSPDLVEATKFSITTSNSEQGLWSYAGPKPIHYPGCQFDYMMDTGARNAGADEGALVSLNSCTTPPCDALILNAQIQDQLLKTRPYGGTPIAASLDDLYFHLSNDLSDVFGSCRNRFGMLLTDGYPDDDYRKLGCGCKQNVNPDAGDYCGATSFNDPNDMKCPYPLPEDAARDLLLGRGTDSPQLQQLFVVGLAVEDSTVRAKLNAIALEGGGAPYTNTVDGETDVAYFARDLPALMTQLSAIIEGAIQPISRTVPVAGQSKSGVARQYQVSTGFELPTDAGDPWTGILERRRFTCNGTNVQDERLDPVDQFHLSLNTQATGNRDQDGGRRLITPLVPFAAGVNTDSHLFHAPTGAPCGPPGNTALLETGACHLRTLNSVTAADLGLPAADPQIALTKDWMYADNGSVRVGKAMGDIYHSTPAIVGSPEFDTADASFNEFRALEVVADRPVMLYVGSNDGILHAFSMEDYLGPPGAGGAGPYNNVDYRSGEEVWGFVPPLFLNNLSANQITHQFMVDGSPVVKDVYFSREHTTTGLQTDPSGNAAEYHTVLVGGMRGGGGAYYALDVTNPNNPEFLWQFTDPDMGASYGQAALIQAVYDPNGGTDYQERAVAVLPGGKGIQSAGSDCPNGVSYTAFLNGSDAYTTFVEIPNSMTDKAKHRRDVPCYQRAGRALYFVDVATGKLIKKVWGTTGPVLPAPIVSTPVMYQAAVGSLATEGYVVDQEGVVWRIDISSINPTPNNPRLGWTMRPYHDLFWDDGRVVNGLIHGEVAYEKPVLTTDPEGRLVVIVGTGDTDDFGKATAHNRVVSLTTVLDPTADMTALTPDDYKAAFNWEKRVRSDGRGLVPSELVTGSMSLFQGQLFFATFISVGTSGDACDLGKGRIHAVDYRARDTTRGNGSTPETYPPMDIPGFSDPDIAINVTAAQATVNRMVMGLGITQRPSCAVVDTGVFDVWNQAVPTIDQLSNPAIYLVAQVSSDGDNSLQRAGSRLGSLQVQVQRTQPLTRVVGWATSTD